jgi:RNA polymerase sigma-70 factor (ECF subfamily)
LILRLCRHFDGVGASPALYPRMNLEECRHEADYMIPEQSGEFAGIQNISEPEEANEEVLGTEAQAEVGPERGEPKAEAQGIEAPAAQNGGGGERDDQALVNAARAGDVLAFGELIKRHWSSCLKRATLMLRNRSDAEDEVQNAFSKALQRIDQFRGDGSFSAWLNRIVENQCLMRIREGQNARFVYLDESTDSNVRLELVSQIEDPEDKLGLDEVLVLLRREVSRMPPLLRNVMLLRDLDQLPMPDVAQKLGLSVPAAKSRLMRARNELRARITKHCGRKGAGTLMQVARYEQSAYTRAH